MGRGPGGQLLLHLGRILLRSRCILGLRLWVVWPGTPHGPVLIQLITQQVVLFITPTESMLLPEARIQSCSLQMCLRLHVRLKMACSGELVVTFKATGFSSNVEARVCGWQGPSMQFGVNI